MPAIYIDTCYLKDILAALPELPPHNWLISGLECYDCSGWEGCEKWAQYELFLTDEQLQHDIDLRNMQIIWGVFSAIPNQYTKEKIYSHPLPETETPYYMSNHIVPQHPLAMLELYVDDGCFTFVSSHDPALLQPLYDLPYKTRDEEADNQAMNMQLRRIQDILRAEVPGVNPVVANEVQWNIWWQLFKERGNEIADDILRKEIRREHRAMLHPGKKYRFRQTIWDPYIQK